MVPHAGQCVSGMPPPLLLQVLRRLGRLEPAGVLSDPPPLRPEAARHPPHVGGTARARGDRAHAARAATRARAVRGIADRGYGAADARGMERIARRRLPREPEA